jgi:hypothetical protein
MEGRRRTRTIRERGTHLVDGHRPNRSVWERVKEMLPQRRRSPCTDGESRSSAWS